MSYYVAIDCPAWLLCAAVLGLWCAGGIVGALLCWALGLYQRRPRPRSIPPVLIEYREGTPGEVHTRDTLVAPPS